MHFRNLLTLTMLTTFGTSAFGTSACAEVKLPSVFGSGMVVQREIDVPVWGWAEVDEEVTVRFRDQAVTTKAGADGTWSVKLKPVAVGDPGTLSVTGSNTITFTDVLVGEVWVCSGQSNMAMALQSSLDPDLEAASAKFPQIRLFQLPPVTADTPQDNVTASWRVCAPENVSSFSAVGFYFGRQLHQTLNVPVGLIQTAWGGTRAEAWTSPAMMAETKELKPILETWEAAASSYDAENAKASYEAALERWTAAVKKAKEAGQQVPRRPQMQGEPRLDRHHPSTLFNAMIAPLTPYAIRGAIWYQGESNSGRAYQYRTLMPAMIQSWRDDWGQGDFSFYQVQLADFMEIVDQPINSAWAELREAQYLATKAIPNVGAACITDIGAVKDIHPKDKQNVGKRLARLALHHDYGMKHIVPQGPTFESMEINGNTCELKFNNHGAALISYYNEPLTGFQICGEDKQWAWGTAVIKGNTVQVSHTDIMSPVAVRYNWSNNPQGTLYNAMYLPAYPFRTDDWTEGTTINNVNP